jgi:hypothetical protein
MLGYPGVIPQQHTPILLRGVGKSPEKSASDPLVVDLDRPAGLPDEAAVLRDSSRTKVPSLISSPDFRAGAANGQADGP